MNARIRESQPAEVVFNPQWVIRPLKRYLNGFGRGVQALAILIAQGVPIGHHIHIPLSIVRRIKPADVPVVNVTVGNAQSAYAARSCLQLERVNPAAPRCKQRCRRSLLPTAVHSGLNSRQMSFG